MTLTVVVSSASAFTGTATLTGGTLSATFPTSLTWTGSLTGADQQIADVVSADQSYTVSDPTGSGAGWHVNATAAQFACSTAGTCNTTKLATTAFTTNGSTSSQSSATKPTATCSGGTCTAATSSLTYPVTIASSATSIFSAAAASGMGNFSINPVGWWLAVPSNTLAGSYTSTITLAVASTP